MATGPKDHDSDINDAMDNILNDMRPDEVQALQAAMGNIDEAKGGDDDDGKGNDDDAKGGGDAKDNDDDDGKGGDDDDGKGGGDDDDDDDDDIDAGADKPAKQVVKPDETALPIDELLALLDLDGQEIAEKLTTLGSNVGLLGNITKLGSFSALKGILEGAQKGGADAAAQFQDLIRNMLKTEGQKYAKCALQFIKLLGYAVSHTGDDILISGGPDLSIIAGVKSNFHHLSNAMQKPVENIYQQLKLVIPPNDTAILPHKSGIFDNQFITFQLIQIVLENQQASLVNKNILDPTNFERFVNFLVPNSCKYLAKDIYFQKLRKMNVQTIGLYGTKYEVLDMLTKYNAISTSLYNVLINDAENRYLQPGIHAILPINLQKGNNFNKWDNIIFLFYWSLPNSFNMKKMKEVKYMRKDPSCLLSRVLYEISSTVCIQVDFDELDSFGVIYELDEDGNERKYDKKSKRAASTRRKKVNKRRGRGRQKLDFQLEETKENMVTCKDEDTNQVQIEIKILRKDERWLRFKAGTKVGALDSCNKWYMADILAVKAAGEEIEENDEFGSRLNNTQKNALWRLNKLQAIFVHYIGWDKKWDEWIFIEDYTCCNCVSDDCTSFMHRLKSKEKQEGGYRKPKWKKMGGSWVTSAVETFSSGLGAFGGWGGGKKNKFNKKNKNKFNKNKKKDKEPEVLPLDAEEGKKEEEEDDELLEYDIASDTFLLNGTKLSGYCQLFKQQEREDFSTLDFVGLVTDEVREFFTDLNKTHIIDWKKSFVHQSQGIEFLGWALCEDEYNEYQKEVNILDKAEEQQLKNDNVKLKVDEILRQRRVEILYEFHKYYTSKKYCRKEHEEIRKIVVAMEEDGILDQDVQDEALYFATVKPQKTSLPKKTYSWFRDVCLEKMGNETSKVLKNYRKSKKNEQAKNKFVKNWVKVYKTQLAYYMDKVQSFVLHRESIKNDVINDIEDGNKKKLNELKVKLEKVIKATQAHKKKVKAAAVPGDGDKDAAKDAAKPPPTAAAASASADGAVPPPKDAPAAAPPSADATAAATVPASAASAPPTATDATAAAAAATTAVKPPSKAKDAKDKDKDKDKDEEMKTATMTEFVWQEKRWNNASEKFIITYTMPTVVPPSYSMKFGSIDLPNATTGNEDTRLHIMRNMEYEILQTDTLVYHQMMTNGDSIMFIRQDNPEMKTNYTKIVASNTRVLNTRTKPLKVIKNKSVQMVAYNASQKIYALLMEDVLAFCVYQLGGRIQITNKRCELRDIAWWDKKMKFKALLIDEIEKNIFVWMVDQNDMVRAYDYDASSWDTAKEFKLDQSYESYQLLPSGGSFLLCSKPQYEPEEEEKKDEPDDKPPPTPIELAKTDLLSDTSTLAVATTADAVVKTDTQCTARFLFKDKGGKDWILMVEVAIDASTKAETLATLTIKEVDKEDNALALQRKEFDVIHMKIVSVADLQNALLPPLHKVVVQVVEKVKKQTGRIELHTYLLLEKKKLEYVVHKASSTGYEMGTEADLPDAKTAEEEEKDGADSEAEFQKVDNILLPVIFTCVDNYVSCSQLKIQQASSKDDMILSTVAKDGKLLYHPLLVQVSETRLRINRAAKKSVARRITKLDYMEYMIEKFGSRAAIAHPEDAMLSLHTTYIMKDEVDAKDAADLCQQIAKKICKSLHHKEKKNFEYLDWQCNVVASGDYKENNVSPQQILQSISNGKKELLSGEAWIKQLIVQIPIQIARGINNKFQLMYNGEDDQHEYIQATDSYGLCKAIRFGAYDGLIKSWQGEIKVVTSMGKQSTGKSYMLNHLFGTHFDISGGRCTDGGWLSVKIIDQILYIVCDFEGLGSFERSPQEDMLLATFNSAISNCTIFKCDNRFDRTVEDMFNKFQSGVKIMSGSQNCFTGELLLIIKDVVDTGADAAVADFKRHIERLAQEAELVRNDRGIKESSFFVSQMYKSGLELIPYPPLANEAFFAELNDTLELAIDDIEVCHSGGKIFLDHIKLIMAKLHIGDFSAMSGEQAKIRSQEIRDTLTYAVECGAIVKPVADTSQYGVTFKVDEDQNLLLLDGNQQIAVDVVGEVIPKLKNYKNVIKKYIKYGGEPDVENLLLEIINSISDAGLILGKVESLAFLFEQFSIKLTRNHGNQKHFVALYQLFLDMIYWRRKIRVFKFVKDNTRKFEAEEKREIESLVQAADSRLNGIRDKMKICRRKCEECFYLCLLCKNHEDDNDWQDQHTCYQGSHSCQELCTYCGDKGVKADCGDKCGHSGKHNCQSGAHTCGAKCALKKYGGCQQKCALESGHNKKKKPCKCAAETHYCTSKCAVAVCKSRCKHAYNKKHDDHICIQQTCPYKCQVQCWNDSVKEVTDCGRPCLCEDHDHHLKMANGECKDEGHTCDQEHPCPEFCTEKGNCRVEIHRKIVEKETLITGAGSKIEYDSYADVNAEKRRCCKKILMGDFQHGGDDHKCYAGDITDNIHTCEEKCNSCGYFCKEAFNHYIEKGTFHDCVHGNMRNTVFYATEEIVDTGDNRKYKVGDAGVAEMCNIFCERMGRGHIHLELCQYEGKWKNKRIAKSFIDAANITALTIRDKNQDEGEISEAFLLDGVGMSGYCQVLKKFAKHANAMAEREEDIELDWTGNAAELTQFLLELHSKYKLQWDQQFVANAEGMEVVASTIVADEYNAYTEEKSDLDKAEQAELKSDIIDEKTEEKIQLRHEEIEIEFHENYISGTYCKSENEELIQMIEDLQKAGKLRKDLDDAMVFAKLQTRKTTLPGQVYSWFRDTCLAKMKQDLTKLVADYQDYIINGDKSKTDDMGNQCIAEWLKLYKEQLEYYKDNVHGGGKTDKSILHRDTIKAQLEEEVAKAFTEKRRMRLEKMIQDSQNKKQQKGGGGDADADQDADADADAAADQMKTITLTEFAHAGAGADGKDKYTIKYSASVVIPSLFYLQFGSIETNRWSKDLKVEVMFNKEYTIGQRDKLVFNTMVKNDMVMFIREEAPEFELGGSKPSKTKIIASSNRNLSINDNPVQEFDAEGVQLVAYLESEKLFGILLDKTLCFCKYEYASGNISMTGQKCDLTKEGWWDENLLYKALMMEKIENVIFVWLVDENGTVRAYNIDNASWEKAKEFTLDQEYESYALYPSGEFLIAFKAQYKAAGKADGDDDDDEDEPDDDGKDDGKDDADDADEDGKDDEKGDDDASAPVPVPVAAPARKQKNMVATGRIEVHAFLLLEKQKLEYVVHKDSSTGYETGAETDLPEAKSSDGYNMVDNLLLPEEFAVTDDFVRFDLLKLQTFGRNDDTIVSTVSTDGTLLYTSLQIKVSKTSKSCVEEEGRRHQSKKYMPNPEIGKDEVKHGKFWRRKKWKDPCVEKFRKLFDKCNFVCQHQVHEDRAAKGEKDEVKFCVESLWHKGMATPSGHTFNCKHPFGNAHVVFVCDISGSMSSTDYGKSIAQYSFIRDSGGLENRLGALYSAIHTFLTVRLQKGCMDCVSAIMFDDCVETAVQQVTADDGFVSEYLLKYKPRGCTSFNIAFDAVRSLLGEDTSMDTVVIFLTDGEASDSGTSTIVKEVAAKLGAKFSLFCILLGAISETGNSVVEGICNAGGGTMLSALSGNELGTTFSSIAKQMNTGAFGKF